MHHISFRALVGCSLVFLMSLLGLSCSSSSSLHPVRGKVLHNGQPLAKAMVTFHPKQGADLQTLPPTGLTNDDGTFTLSTGDKAGAPAGEYIVTIICSEEVAPKKGEISTGPPETQDKLNGVYANRDSSKIVVTVKPGDNQLEPFDLK